MTQQNVQPAGAPRQSREPAGGEKGKASRKTIGLKAWLLYMLLSLAICGLAFAGFNWAVDPFGVFGDKLMNWYAYDMTNNPRVSKIAYLDQHHENYDSYIIGCSKTSSFSTEKLNAYYGGASFYNMLMYGGDMYDIEKTALYIIENYQPENIILNIGLEEAVSYNVEEDPVKNNLHAKVEGSSALFFYLKYLFLHPQYALDKLQAYSQKSYLPGASDVFVPQTGVYNKLVRDTEPIGSLADYMAAYPDFDATYGFNDSLPAMEECLSAIQAVKEACQEQGITFRLIVSPIYYQELLTYEKEDLSLYWQKLAQITDFWDFTGFHSVSYEPRYFYDAYHFRNTVGDMALAKMFGDTSVYVPQDLGYYVTKDNVNQRISTCFTPSAEGEAYAQGRLEQAQTALGQTLLSRNRQIPVLMYHGLGYEEDNEAIITPQRFEEQLRALKEAGYTSVLFEDLISFVDQGAPLPEKLVAITFDDGYQSNFDYAYPVLCRLQMPATIHLIGISVGKDTYKDTGEPMYPHFTWETAREMEASGFVDLQSHSYDMHQVASLDGEDCRQGVYPRPGETEEEYIKAFREDFRLSKEGLTENTGSSVSVYAYPYGFHTAFSEALLSELGIRVSLTVEPGMNTILQGLPQSLLCLKRYTVTDTISAEELLDMLSGI